MHRSIPGLIALVALGVLGAPATSRAQNWTFLRADATDKPVSAVRVFRLMGEVSEEDGPLSLFRGGSGVNFPELVASLDRESRRPEVQALVLRLGASFGLGQGQELAAAIKRAQALKKRVIVHLESASTGQLMAVSGADSVVLTPEGSLFLTGLRAEVSYYKDLLTTLGVQADIEAVGRYKSAAEPMRLATMSEAAREQLEALLDSLFKSVLAGLGDKKKRRDAVEVGKLVDTGLFTAEEAKKNGLVDEIAYWPELLAELNKRYSTTATLAYPVPDEAPDLSSIFSIIELLTKSPTSKETGRARVALVVAEGPIVLGSGGRSLLGAEREVASDDFIATLDAVAADPLIKAVVLRIDSPGGSALASDLMWRAITKLAEKRPVVASLGNVAASGGYYIASAAKTILAEDAGITGSIGVFGGKLVVGELLDKLGVHTVVISRGQNAGLMSSLSRFSDSERAVFRANMEHTYATFVNRVRQGRGMAFDAVEKIAQGRVWTGEQARGVGLVDRRGGLYEALEDAAKAAGLKLADVDIVRYPKSRSLLEMLSGDPTRLLAPELRAGIWRSLPEPLRGRAEAAVSLFSRLLAREQALAMMPFELVLQ